MFEFELLALASLFFFAVFLFLRNWTNQVNFESHNIYRALRQIFISDSPLTFEKVHSPFVECLNKHGLNSLESPVMTHEQFDIRAYEVMERHFLMEAAYCQLKINRARLARSMGFNNFGDLLTSLFLKFAPGKAVLLTTNDYTYNWEGFHLLLWFKQNQLPEKTLTYKIIIDELEKFLQCKIDLLRDVSIFTNPPANKTIPELDHVHIFLRPGAGAKQIQEVDNEADHKEE